MHHIHKDRSSHRLYRHSASNFCIMNLRFPDVQFKSSQHLLRVSFLCYIEQAYFSLVLDSLLVEEFTRVLLRLLTSVRV